jgi:sirohydrochlorin ferrochelatase
MAWGRRKPRGTRVIDRFAEALAECGDVPTAAARLGIKRDYANSLFANIRKQLGSQAK